MTPVRLGSVIERFADCRVLCIGDVMLDRFVYGRVDRISPEAPIPVFSIHDERTMLGGAGNVARNLVSLGAASAFISVTGHDKTGRDIAAMVGKEALITPYLIAEPGRLSTIKTRYVAGTQQVLRADHEVLSPLQEATAQRLVDAAVPELEECGVVLLSDYGKGVFTRPLIRRVIDEARAHNKPVLVDPKSRDFSLYAGASCVCPNQNELAAASATDIKTEEDIIAAARTLMQAHGIAHMLVTRGSRGMVLVPAEGEALFIPARAREVFDVSGAGDTAIATLALGVAAGLDFADAARLANIAAGIVVGRLGTAVITADDMRTALLSHHPLDGMQKIQPLAAMLDQVGQWKREGQRVGFTNGCFDLVHPGHLALLNACKATCDRLVVGLNSDASVKRLKGPKRPVNGENERALLLASLSVVDAVVLFEEDTPVKLIEAIRPDYLMKGADYQKHQVVGHEIVEAYGGEVVLIPLREGYSSTNIIQKMA